MTVVVPHTPATMDQQVGAYPRGGLGACPIWPGWVAPSPEGLAPARLAGLVWLSFQILFTLTMNMIYIGAKKNYEESGYMHGLVC